MVHAASVSTWLCAFTLTTGGILSFEAEASSLVAVISYSFLPLGLRSVSVMLASIITPFFTNISFSQSNAVSFTQEDRDRMIRTETKLDEKFKQAEDRSNQMQKQIDEVKADIKWYFGILIGAMFMLFGFILWDRRTFIKPFQTRVDEVEIEVKKEKGKSQL